MRFAIIEFQVFHYEDTYMISELCIKSHRLNIAEHFWQPKTWQELSSLDKVRNHFITTHVNGIKYQSEPKIEENKTSSSLSATHLLKFLKFTQGQEIDFYITSSELQKHLLQQIQEDNVINLLKDIQHSSVLNKEIFSSSNLITYCSEPAHNSIGVRKSHYVPISPYFKHCAVRRAQILLDILDKHYAEIEKYLGEMSDRR